MPAPAPVIASHAAAAHALGKFVFQAPGCVHQRLILQPVTGLVLRHYRFAIKPFCQIHHWRIPERTFKHFIFLIVRFNLADPVSTGTLLDKSVTVPSYLTFIRMIY